MRYPSMNEIVFSVRQLPWRRIVSFVLAMVLFTTSAPFPVLSVESVEQGSGSVSAPNSSQLIYDYDTLKITRDGEQIGKLDLLSHEKIEIAADGISEDASYQWQVQHPEKDDVWVNVYDGTKQTISVTMALVENVLRENGTAKLRCRAYTDTYAYLTNPVTVKVRSEETAVTPARYAMARSNDGIMLAAEGEKEFVTVSIHYVKYEYVKHVDSQGKESYVLEEKGEAYGAYVATLLSGSPLNVKVPNPSLVGYNSKLVLQDGQTGATEVNGVVEIALSDITEDITFRVEYRPAKVPYSVHYYFQNIYDDQYVEDNALAPVQNLTGETGTQPDMTYTHAVFDGFTSLFYEPDIIAGDGSTVFNVYYERNYYLMEFDCNEGYGTDTIYVRYGTYVAVANPVKAGWVFSGWDLVSTDNIDNTEVVGDGHENALPGSMPAYNSGYKALWTKAETSYTVAYWIVDAYGNKTYIGSRTVNSKEENGALVPIKSGDKVDGVHDLASKADGGPAICGYEEHSHEADGCYTCGLGEHTHTTDCFDGMSLAIVSGADANRDAAIADLENGGAPESGYIYVIYNHAETSKSYWPKLYLDGNYYIVDGVGDGSPWLFDEASFSSIVDGEALASKTGTYGTETLTTTKYRPATACNTTQHTHDNSCRDCMEHTHLDSCYQDERHLVEVDEVTLTDKEGKTVTIKTDKNVTVQGDGSTVVNVYYEYQEYTLKFYYAATTGGTADDQDNDASTYDTIKIVGGTTYYFGRSGTNSAIDETLLENEYWNYSGEWGSISTLPTLNEEGARRKYTKGSVTYEHNSTNVTYHYISFKARYGDDISGMWPCAVFNPADRTDKNNANGWSGTKAFVSAWNGEHHVKYSEKGNQTIKGVYEKLDDWLLFDPTYLSGLSDSDKNDLEKNGTEISYLCFWENGANIGWSVPELYRYKIWLEGNAPNGETTVTKNNVIVGYQQNGTPIIRDGVTFYLADSYDTCDNSTVGEQTQVGLTGYNPCYLDDITKIDFNKVANMSPTRYFDYTSMTGTTDATLLQQSGYYSSSLYKEGYEVNFYYIANRHSLKFYNYNGWLGSGAGAGNSGEGEGVRFGTPLSVFGNYVNEQYMLAHYPDGLEPGAYEFKDWYTSPGCLDGTKVDWEKMTMPDADLTLYAKWEPVKRNVYFYLTYDHLLQHEADPSGDYTWDTKDYLGNDVTYPIVVEHGAVLGTTYHYMPVRNEDFDNDGVKDYTFVGWFYMDEDNKKRFAPDTMEIKRDLHLFAEWQSQIDTQYKVEYVLKEDATIKVDGVDQSYPAGTPIAVITEGHSTAGRTKTFTAKAGDQLLAAFQNAPVFPETNTHSILMDADYTQNRYTFYYVVDDLVYYKVRYVDKVTGEVLGVKKVNGSENLESHNAIVTEKFQYFDGYVPEQFYIRKVLAADGNATSAIEANIITFYYLPNSVDNPEALYNVEYYKWNPQTNAYEQTQNEPGRGVINESVTVTVPKDKFNGYAFVKGEVVTYHADSTSATTTYNDHNLTQLKANLSQYGLVFKLYYDPIEYPYLIKFVEYGNPTNILGYGKLGDNAIHTLNQVLDVKAPFGTELTYTAPDSIEKDGKKYNFIQNFDQTQTLEIRIEPTSATDASKCTVNILTFYYEVEVIPIEYYAVCTVPGIIGGKVSQSFEPTPQNPIGCDAMKLAGFTFVGWFYDEACTQKVPDAWLSDQTDAKSFIRPVVSEIEKDTDGKEHFYARFEPIVTWLTIRKNVSNSASCDDTFLFRIQGKEGTITAGVDLIVSIKGNGVVVIEELYCGEYNITELTDWSWEYSVSESAMKSLTAVADSTQNVVTFTNTYVEPDWLGGESSNENIFTNP